MSTRRTDGPTLLEVGRIGRPHGLKGEVVVDFVTDRTAERAAPGAELFIDGEPIEVATARPHQQRWLVRFVGVADRDGAERLRGATLEAEPLDDPDVVFVHELIGRHLVDQHGTDHGPVVSVVANPASDLLELGDGRLVPLAFLDPDPDANLDPGADAGSAPVDDDGPIRVTVPPGLLDDEPS